MNVTFKRKRNKFVKLKCYTQTNHIIWTNLGSVPTNENEWKKEK